MRPVGVFFTQNMAGERSKKHPKSKHQKSKKKCEKGGPKGRPKKCFFLIFLDLGPKAPQGAPKDPYKHRPRSNLIENGTKMVCIILFL